MYLRTPFRSLRHFLTTLVLAVVLPSLLFSLIAAWLLAQRVIEERKEDASRLAAAAAESMSNHLESMTASLAILSRLPLGEDRLAAFYQIARGFSLQAGYHVTLGDAEGRQYLSTRRPFGTPLPRRKAMDSVRRAVDTGRAQVSDLFLGQVAGTFIVTVDTPVQTPDGLRIITLASDASAMAEALFETRVPPGWLLGLVDGQGAFIARSRDAEQWVGQPVPPAVREAGRKADQGMIENTSVEGFPILSFFHRVPGTDWRVLVGIPRSVLYASLFWPLGILGVALVLVVAVTVLLALGFTRQLDMAAGRLMATARDPLGRQDTAPGTNPIAEFEEVSRVIRFVAAKREQLATALDMTVSIIRDLDGRITHWTTGCELLYGWTRQEAVGRLSHELLQTEYPEPLADIERTLRSRGEWSGELDHRLKDGRRLRVSAHWIMYAMEQGRMPSVMETVHDLSAETRLELALGESELRFRGTFEQVAVGMAHLSMEGRWLRVNQKLGEIVGRQREELLGLGYLDVTHPEDQAANQETWRQIRSGQVASCCLEKRYIRPDGSAVWANVTLSLAHTRAGEPDYVIAVVEDIQHRKEIEFALEEERETFHNLTRIASDYFWETDIHGRMRAISRPGTAKAGIDHDSFVGKHPWEQPCTGVSEAEWAAHQAILDARQPFRNFELGIVAGEEVRWFSISGDPVFSRTGEFKGYRGVSQDITERRHRQEWLEKQVAERTADLVAANKELEGFVYAASHDLRAPLGRINSFSTLLARGYRDRLEGDGLLFLDLIQGNANRLVALVDDLLAHAQLGRKMEALQPVDARAVIHSILLECREDIRDLGAEIQVDLPDTTVVMADFHCLAQVFRNLVGNALKYSRQATPPVIAIGGGREGKCWHLWVRDNGIGFDMAYHDRIFEIFRRLHTYDEFPGSGIGLALVRKAMERMGGRVWAQSTPGEGATFHIELAAGEDPAPAAITAAAPALAEA